jgi:hypothetical protein
MRVLDRFILMICLSIFTAISSQTTGNRTVSVSLPVVAILDVEPSGNLNFNFIAPTEAGRPLVNPASDNTKWLNYTSAIAPGGVSRRVTASINQTIPGVDIKLQAATASGMGAGVRGTPVAQITLSTASTTIINGIGGAYTGTGTNNGHRIIISVTTNNYSNLSARSNTPVVITYTITE